MPDECPETSFLLTIDSQCPESQLTDRDAIWELIDAALCPYITVDDVIIIRPPTKKGKKSTLWCKVNSESLTTLKTIADEQRNQVHCILSRVWINFPSSDGTLGRGIRKMNLQPGTSSDSANGQGGKLEENPVKEPVTPKTTKSS